MKCLNVAWYTVNIQYILLIILFIDNNVWELYKKHYSETVNSLPFWFVIRCFFFSFFFLDLYCLKYFISLPFPPLTSSPSFTPHHSHSQAFTTLLFVPTGYACHQVLTSRNCTQIFDSMLSFSSSFTSHFYVTSLNSYVETYSPKWLHFEMGPSESDMAMRASLHK